MGSEVLELNIAQDSIWRSKTWWSIIIGLSLSVVLLIILQTGLSNDQTKEIQSFKTMNCQEQKQFLLKNINENKVGVYPYSVEQSFYELECLSK